MASRSLNSVQRALCADVSRKIFGHVGYTGINVQTGRKKLRKKFRLGDPSELPLEIPGPWDAVQMRRRDKQLAKLEHKEYFAHKDFLHQKNVERRAASAEYSEKKRARMAEEAAIAEKTGGLTRKQMEKEMDKRGLNDEDDED